MEGLQLIIVQAMFAIAHVSAKTKAKAKTKRVKTMGLCGKQYQLEFNNIKEITKTKNC